MKMIARYATLPTLALAADAWNANRGRLLLSVVGVALGVALGVAVHLINGSAVGEFNAAARQLSGDADLSIRGPLGGFDESIYPRIAAMPEVDVASPAIELDLRIPGKRALHLLAIDPFQALRIQPRLFGDRMTDMQRFLDPDAILLSRAAADGLGVSAGERITVQAGTTSFTMTIVAVLAAEASSQRIAYADIATAQWRLGRLGSIDRIDVRLAPGADRRAVSARIASMLPPGVHVSGVDTEAQDAIAMTRAYRINLDMLLGDVLLHHEEVDAAVLLAPFFGVVRNERLLAAPALRREARGVDAFLLDLVGHDGLRAIVGELLVRGRVAFGAGVTLDGDLLHLGVGLDHLGDVMEERRALRLDDRLVDLELNLLFEVDLVVAQLDARRRLHRLRDGRGRKRGRRKRWKGRRGDRQGLSPGELRCPAAGNAGERKRDGHECYEALEVHGRNPTVVSRPW